MKNILNKIEEKNIRDKIEYWIFIWNDLIDNYMKTNYGLNFSNIHILIEELLEEIEFNNLKNSNNKKFFRDSLGVLLKEDVVIKTEFNTEVNSLIEYLNANKNNYVKSICNHIDLTIFKSRKYIKKIHEVLNEILLRDSLLDTDYSNIKYLTENLIIEFLLLGYSLEEIKKILENIFDYFFEYENVVTTKLPIAAFVKQEDIKEYVINLTLEQRLSLINEYIRREYKEFFVIYKLKGFRGTKGLICGDVEFYNPKFKTHINSDFEEATEYENWNEEKIVEIPHYYNAIVKVVAIGNEQAKIEACRKIESVLDTIRCFYNSNNNFTIAKENSYILDSEKNIISMSWGAKEPEEGYEFYKREDDIFISDNEYLQGIFKSASNFMFKRANEYNETERKILESLRRFRKGIESEKSDEKLLNYWICIENIVNINRNKFDNILIDKGEETALSLAQEIITPIFIRFDIYNSYHQLYYAIYNLCQPRYRGEREGEITYSEEIVKKFNLSRSKSKIDLTSFVKDIDELDDNTNKYLAKEKTQYINKLYNDNAFSISELEKKRKQIESNILQIYRYRNMIVHDAHFNEIFLEYYTKLSEKYARRLLVEVIELYCKNSNNLTDILLMTHFQFKMLLKNLKQKSNIHLKHYILNQEL